MNDKIVIICHFWEISELFPLGVFNPISVLPLAQEISKLNTPQGITQISPSNLDNNL